MLSCHFILFILNIYQLLYCEMQFFWVCVIICSRLKYDRLTITESFSCPRRNIHSNTVLSLRGKCGLFEEFKLSLNCFCRKKLNNFVSLTCHLQPLPDIFKVGAEHCWLFFGAPRWMGESMLLLILQFFFVEILILYKHWQPNKTY